MRPLPSLTLAVTSTALAILSTTTPTRAAEETKAESRIESVGLFKNGLAVVRRAVDVKSPGVYRLDDVPEPVHGTFWVESPFDVDSRVTWREVELPAGQGSGSDLQTELAGRKVTIFFRDGNPTAVQGTVAKLPREKNETNWNRQYQQPNYFYDAFGRLQQPPAPIARFLILDTPAGREFVDPATIAHLNVEGKEGTAYKKRQAVLLLDVKENGKLGVPAGPITVTYLTKGMAWAPAYHVDLADDKTLSIEQQAVVRNELGDLSDTEIRLISGFPSVQYAHVLSPMSTTQTWSSFFQQITQTSQVTGRRGELAQQVLSNSVMHGPGDDGIDLSATPAGEGVDLHFQSLGKRTLAEGDSLTTSVARGNAPYERLVEWIVPDSRDAYGRWTRQNGQDLVDDDAAWDAVRFKNPLPFAMTTAAAVITEKGRFAGQRLSGWVNAGEQTTLQITKALSVRTRASEREEPGEREVVYIAGNDFQKVKVGGELRVANHRAKDVQLVIRRQFSGDLTSADADPKLLLREEGVYSVNRRNELTWTLTLKPGEERTLQYHYTVLVDR